MKEHQWEWFFCRRRRRRRFLSRKLVEHLQWAIYSNAVPWCRRSEIQLSLIFVDFYISLPIPLHSHIRQYALKGFIIWPGISLLLAQRIPSIGFLAVYERNNKSSIFTFFETHLSMYVSVSVWCNLHFSGRIARNKLQKEDEQQKT